MSEAGDYTESEDEGEANYTQGGYHRVAINDVLGGRYHVIAKLGWGHFSTVWLCLDEKNNGYVAMKIQKSAQHYTQAAYDEIDLLTSLSQHATDPAWVSAGQARLDMCGISSTGCVRLLDYFAHPGPNGTHICMVFDVLGPNVLALIKRCEFRGVPVESVRKVAAHTLAGLDYLHRFCGVIHTDLKPENVLVTCPWRVPIDKQGFPLVDVRSMQATERAGHELPALPKPPKVTLPTVPDSSPPYVKSTMQPSRSDPTLLASVGENPKHQTPYSWRPVSEAAPPKPRAFDYIAPEAMQRFISEGVNPFTHPQAQFRLADLGNACWIHRHFSEEIQTRQYRCPEVILGAGYGPSADIWSLACMTFELVTGDYLFDPKGTDEYPRDEDHLALCIELLGQLPAAVLARARHRRTYFNLHGELRHIKSLRGADLESVLRHKYRMAPVPARSLASFLLPMLDMDPERRPSAEEALQHPWLRGLPSENCDEFFPPQAALAVPDDARCASGPRDEQRAVPTARAHERDAAPTRVERAEPARNDVRGVTLRERKDAGELAGQLEGDAYPQSDEEPVAPEVS